MIIRDHVSSRTLMTTTLENTQLNTSQVLTGMEERFQSDEPEDDEDVNIAHVGIA
jgi:hypothetical protein